MKSCVLFGLLLALSSGCSSDDPADGPDGGTSTGTDAGDGPGGDAGSSGLDAATPGSDAMPPPASGAMTFFVTSEGNGASGGDYGGLAGADLRCQTLAAAVSADDRTWCAYLSNAAIAGLGTVVHARDRIGAGPWYNAAETLIAADLASLHANGIASSLMLDEKGDTVPNSEHDLLTGSTASGQLQTSCEASSCTCLNWTDSTRSAFAWVGHTDGDDDTWNDGRHRTRCDEQGMGFVNGSGRLLCFATSAPSCPTG